MIFFFSWIDFWIFGLICWIDFFLFFEDGFKCNYVVKAAVKWVILLIGYSVFLKHKYFLGR